MLPRAIADIVGGTHTLEIKTQTYYEHGSYESFTCSAICAEQTADEGTSSSTVQQTDLSESNPIEHSEEKSIERLIKRTSIHMFKEFEILLLLTSFMFELFKG